MAEIRAHHFHGRRVARPLRRHPLELMEALLPALRVANTAPDLAEPKTLFPHKPDEVWLEIGFGGGEHLAHRAAENPHIGLIGAEPFVNGVAKLLSQIEEHRLKNIRICDDDARYLVEKLGFSTISRAFILYPDPWPKARHLKRRIISDQLVAELARVLKPGAEFLFASDIPHYAAWTLEHLALLPERHDHRQRP
jgi:tRNA (guanine-N7-)-methyltransferase